MYRKDNYVFNICSYSILSLAFYILQTRYEKDCFYTSRSCDVSWGAIWLIHRSKHSNRLKRSDSVQRSKTTMTNTNSRLRLSKKGNWFRRNVWEVWELTTTLKGTYTEIRLKTCWNLLWRVSCQRLNSDVSFINLLKYR